MKRILSLMLIASAGSGTLRACDVCGCSASAQYLGVLPKAGSSFIGLQYLYNSFRSEHPSLFENRPGERTRDYYNTAQLWGRYSLGRRVQLFGFVPYRYNSQQTDTGSYTVSGMGDVSLLANVLLLKEDPASEAFQQQLLAGAGLKMPTGGCSGVTERDKLGLPNMQPGTGAWDVILNANYTLRRKRTGLNLDAAYTLTTANADRYKYGNRLNAGLLVFRSFSKGIVSLMPQLGFRYEHTLHDYDNYERRWLNRQSGGYMAFATAGVQVYVQRLGFRFTYQLPLSQHYAAGYVLAQHKLDAGVFLLF
jgi:hypothetical protein